MPFAVIFRGGDDGLAAAVVTLGMRLRSRDSHITAWFRTAITGDDPEVVISTVLESFHKRGVSCLWWAHPSATPRNLGQLLVARGMPAVEHAIGMSIDLREWKRVEPATTDVRYVELGDDATMDAYSELIFNYWEVPEESRTLVDEVAATGGPGRAPVHRWVAFDGNDLPVGKVMLSLAAPAGVAAIYGMSVRPEARGKGVASAFTNIAIERAQSVGCTRVVLHSSEMAIGVYERAGFTKQCEMTVYANAPVWANREA